ncbi:unnamed protein product [Pipistrellus nathusii]|uniref:Uncharacterized protein n=1 Tax=Pipistrellus nathusii TaxID=59473 RepID=A0ABP0AM00_PIPNA
MSVAEEAESPVEVQGKPEEQQRAEPGPCGTSAQHTLEALEALHVQLSTKSARTSRAYMQVRSKTFQCRKPILERRRAIIQCVPHFWGQAVSLPKPFWLPCVQRHKDHREYVDEEQGSGEVGESRGKSPPTHSHNLRPSPRTQHFPQDPIHPLQWHSTGQNEGQLLQPSNFPPAGQGVLAREIQ